MVSEPLIKQILREYSLPLNGIHGPAHWARVLETGERLAKRTGADIEVVKLFALFHDCRRVNEGMDHGHGRRAAQFAESLRDSVIDLEERRFGLLSEACTYHTDGKVRGDVTVRTCWDADRLDLGRIGIRLDPRFLCTAAAKDGDMLRWADDRARARHVPSIVEAWSALREGED